LQSAGIEVWQQGQRPAEENRQIFSASSQKRHVECAGDRMLCKDWRPVEFYYVVLTALATG
jgi:hypothetical protein